MINGSPTHNNTTLFKKGAHNIIDARPYNVVAEFDTPDWSPDKAQEWMAGQVTQFGDSIVGVYAANDGTGGGAIAAIFFFKQKTAYEVGLGIPAEPLFRSLELRKDRSNFLIF